MSWSGFARRQSSFRTMGKVVALNNPAGQWHTVRALESGSVILEMKEGAYEPIGTEDILSL